MHSRNKRTRFDIEWSFAEGRLEEVESFIRHSREGMKATWSEFEERFQRRTAGWVRERVQDHVDGLIEEISQLRDVSPQLLRHAQCMVVYGTFEDTLKRLCMAVHRDKQVADPPPKRFDMLKGKRYLETLVAAVRSPFRSEWTWLDEFRVVRNCMAHNGGTAVEDANPDGRWTRVQRFAKRNRGLVKLDRFHKILVTDALVDRSLKRSKDAMAVLYKSVSKVYP